MQIDPLLPIIVAVLFTIFAIGIVLHRFKQPYVIGYLLIGVLLGTLGFGSQPVLEQFANFGIILLMFFIGMHVSIPKLVSNWKVAIIGTIIQLILTILVVGLVSLWFGWPLQLVLLIAFIISLSSTAVILKILHDWNELDTQVGQNVLGILLVQDLAVIPMLMALDLFAGEGLVLRSLLLQLLGGLLLIGTVIYFMLSKRSRLLKVVRDDHEMQIFVALALCFGFALVAGLFGLSVALGAFIAGIIVSAAKETHWVVERLDPFHIVLVALFFIYVGMLLDLAFLREHLLLIVSIVLGVMALNTLLSTVVLRILGDTWRESIFAGALLSQIGEFSFLLAAVGLQAGIITGFGHQLVISVITVSLLLAPFWIQAIKRLLHIDADYVFEVPKKLRRW